jgi:hypothetical protein
MSGIDLSNPPKPKWIILKDHMVGVRLWFEYSHAINFRSFNVVQEARGDWYIAADGDFHTLASYEDIDYEIEGSIKWDGCINWQTSPECMAHGCGPSYIDIVHAVFTAAYAEAAKHFGDMIKEAKPMPENALEIEAA